MKINSIIGTGSCGLEIRLNIADQFVLTHTIERIEEEYKKKEIREAWDRAYWDCPRESREEWKEKNPRPEEGRIPEEEYHKLFIFCKKLILADGCKDTIFDEESEQAE